MAAEVHGLLDTNILILRRTIDHAELPDLMSISTITLADLSVAIAHRMPLYTTNTQDFEGLKELLEVVPVTRPV
ncbi:hypothetical protein [Amycolatopsis sp. NPDC049868]|uniref:hypothetical protein n=1 Tax=Amycolatopsis sp. NPDC049868 TaxID=3363934 RepID=UPI003799F6D7